MTKKLHLVSFDVPLPADYGGIMDVFYRIKYFHSIGVEVILHCFEYGRKSAPALLQYCSQVFYYHRDKNVTDFFSFEPFIVKTRSDLLLLENLQKDSSPVFFEGIHTCHYLNHPSLQERNKFVRLHNIESDYYNGLAKIEPSLFNKIFFKTEGWKLSRFEKILKYADCLFTVNTEEEDLLKKHFKKVVTVHSFHPNERVECKPGRGDFILYHGNLSVVENIRSVLFLINEVFTNEMNIKIAGKCPDTGLKRELSKHSNITLVGNPDEIEMKNLIQQAHIITVPTTQPVGLKLKLINTLFNGRHVIANSNMTSGSSMSKLCHICDDAETMRNKILELSEKDFTTEEIRQREKVLLEDFSNQKNIERLSHHIFQS